MSSPLSFNSTEEFRKRLLVRNLPPFNNVGFSPTTNPGQSELTLTDYSVIDSAQVEDIGRQEEVRLYTKNLYGPPNGYDNRYSVSDVKRLITKRDTYFKFIASRYSPLNILLSNDPRGSNGLLSQDSTMMQIAAMSLKNEFQFRVDEEIRQQTLGRLNFLNALKDPFIASDILTGRQELIEPDWKISSPTNLIAKGLDFISRITGVYLPFSWIPGDYFEGRRSYLNESVNILSNLFGGGDVLPKRRNGSEIFLNYTGRGQKNQMFKSLEFNKFRPDYRANFISDLNIFAPSGNYYVGSRSQDPDTIISPQNELPVDEFGKKVQIAVRGYSELGELYEGGQNFRFGLDSVYLGNEPGLQGGFTWSSTDSNDAAGKKVRSGGVPTEIDENFNSISSQWTSSSSTKYSFTPGSILDDTQKLINAADGLQGIARLSHVGTAINQVSKVFFDGNREITKGSTVKRYVNQNGVEVGQEYCRVFTKDTPYFTMNDLQKSEGNIRGFQNSVLTNTYNLNIAPQKSGGIPQNFGEINDENITKYMLSLENLAWRTSDLQQDLPDCEKGPLGGRIMWFPPYDLRVDENVTSRWNSNDFLGRPEPIYTYSNTQRVGSLNFKIIVDHPSVLNTLVNEELANVTPDSQVNKIVDSFFAGCKTLDIYELLRKFGQFSLNDIVDVVTKTTNSETFKNVFEEVPKDSPEIDEKPAETESTIPNFSEFEELELFFDNDFPEGFSTTETTSLSKYETYFNDYIGKIQEYIDNAKKINEVEQVQTFFDDNITNSKQKLDNFIIQAVDAANNGYTINISLVGSASAPNSNDYNLKLSERRIDSVKKQIIDNPHVAKINAGDKGKIKVVSKNALGKDTGDCSTPFTEPSKRIKEIYSTRAMGCRKTTISEIKIIPQEQVEKPVSNDEFITNDVITEGPNSVEKIVKGQGAPIDTENLEIREEITKKLLRKMLTECDYFEQLTDDTSFLFEGIKEKIKHFNPSFHSITPEGLNSRLTFLQQCLRPGDTIPTIGPNGEPLQNDALNTSFGTPPVCVLRVGDFWHTKIVITQMSIRYEPLLLDLNPEGIGVQPMLADVNLSFNFIGGHGLREPVAKLQNALSFNYYANTEMYDERADITEKTNEIDSDFINNTKFDTPFSIKNIVNETSAEGGTPIGTITSQDITITGDSFSISGVISYKESMDDLLDKSQDYKNTLVSSLETVANQYGEIGLRLFTDDFERIYTEGSINISTFNVELPVTLFGKPELIDKKFEIQFNKALKDVDDGTFPLIPDNTSKFKSKDLKKYKKKIKEIIERQSINYSNTMVNEIQTITEAQLKLTRVLDKINVVQKEVDGIINDKGNPVVYKISATTETFTNNFNNTLDELQFDYTELGTLLNNFNIVLGIQDIITNSSDKEYNENLTTKIKTTLISTEQEKRFYLLFFEYILKNKDILLDELVVFILSNNFTNEDDWIKEIFVLINNQYTKFDRAKSDTKDLFKNYSDSSESAESNEDVYTRGKIRKFKFSDDPLATSSEKEKIKQLYSGVNGGDNNKWNNKVKLQ